MSPAVRDLSLRCLKGLVTERGGGTGSTELSLAMLVCGKMTHTEQQLSCNPIGIASEWTEKPRDVVRVSVQTS